MNFLRHSFFRQTRKVGELSLRLSEIENQIKQLAESHRIRPPVVIEHAERVIIEKIDYSNHFDTLDIEALEGQLNIGLNYHGVRPADELFPVLKGRPSADVKGVGQESGDVPKMEREKSGPKYNIRAQKGKTVS